MVGSLHLKVLLSLSMNGSVANTQQGTEELVDIQILLLGAV